MIQIICKGCQTQLTIDDGFAGGVCRCQHCGTIQAVPKIKAPARVAAPQAAASELEELAEVVATEPQDVSLFHHEPQKRYIGWIVATAILGVLAVGGIVYVLNWAHRIPPETTPEPPQTTPKAPPASPAVKIEPLRAPVAPAKKEPNFMGVGLKGPGIVYLLDRGQGTVDTMAAIKGAAARSIESLGAGQTFQVMFWMTEKPAVFPEKGMKAATAAEVKGCKEFMADVYAFGQSKIEGPLEAALKQQPAEIVIASGKGMLDEAFVKAVLDRCKGKAVKVHTFALGAYGSPGRLKEIAEKTGGEFREIKGPALQEYSAYSP